MGAMGRLRYIFAVLIHFSWGIIQSLLGACIALILLVRGERPQRFRASWVIRWPSRRGLSLGAFIFLPHGAGSSLIVHEYGHCIQSLIAGPFYLPLFALPSMVWAGVPRLSKMRRAQKRSYYSLYTERSANWLGEKVTGSSSPGQSFID